MLVLLSSPKRPQENRKSQKWEGNTGILVMAPRSWWSGLISRHSSYTQQTVPNPESMRIISASFPSYQSLVYFLTRNFFVPIPNPNLLSQTDQDQFQIQSLQISVLNQLKQYILVNYRALSPLKKEKSKHALPTRWVSGICKQGRWWWKLRSQMAIGLEALSCKNQTKPWRVLKSSSLTEVVIFDCNYEILILIIA